jgi:tape measure domain-containing protein
MIQGGEVRYVVYIGGVQQATTGLLQMETSANRAEASISNLNNALRTTAGALGIGIGAHALVSFAKDAIQSAADYETAVKRIMFSSENFAEGQKNIAFITAEAERYKIPIQEATDAYGKFLAMLAGSDIASDRIRNLHDQLLLIGKIKGLDNSQLDAAVMNLGKMLEAGGLDARHFRPLEQQLSGIGAFVAKELGMSVHQLALLRNQGKLTQVDPQVLLTAIEKMYESLKQFEPEATKTIQSGLNDVSNAWLKFKNDLVFENRSELIQLFGTLKDGIGYLADHKDDIIAFGHVLVGLGKAWVGYHGTMLLVNGAMTAYQGLVAWYTGESAVIISATEAQAVAMNSLAAAMERVAYATEVLAGASLSGVVGVGALGIPLATAGTTATATGAAAGAGAAVSAGIGAAVLPVAVMYFAGEALNALIPKAQNGYQFDWKDLFTIIGRLKIEQAYLSGDYVMPNKAVDDGSSLTSNLLGLSKNRGLYGYGKDDLDPRTSALQRQAAKASHKIVAPTDTVTGQRVVTYNISIKEINGIKQNTVQEGGSMNEEQTAEKLREIIINTLKDSQIMGN